MAATAKAPAAIILAGGFSTRFGEDKVGALWRGRRLIDHVVDRLPAERSATLLVLRREQRAEGWPVDRVVHDDPDLPAGPLRGVIRGLESCNAEWAWLVACDLPLISAPLLRHLAAVADRAQAATIPCWAGRPQPLQGLYRAEAAPRLAACLASGERSLVGALNALGVRWVAEEECRRLDPAGESFVNINRTEQLVALGDRSVGVDPSAEA